VRHFQPSSSLSVGTWHVADDADGEQLAYQYRGSEIRFARVILCVFFAVLFSRVLEFACK